MTEKIIDAVMAAMQEDLNRVFLQKKEVIIMAIRARPLEGSFFMHKKQRGIENGRLHQTRRA